MRLKVMFLEEAPETGERRRGRIGEVEQAQVLRGDDAVFDHGFEIDDFPPEFGAVEDNLDAFIQLLSLGESEDFRQFVQGPESAGKDDQSSRDKRTRISA